MSKDRSLPDGESDLGRRAERAGNVQPRKSPGEAVSRCVNEGKPDGDNKEDGATLLSAVPHQGTTAMGTN